MFPGRAMLAALVAAVTLATGCTARDAGHPGAGRGLDAVTVDRLDTAVTEAMAAAAVPGAIVGVWSPEGDYVKAFGVADTADRTPMKVDFYSRIGSVTKTFTATAVLQLVERNRIGLDTPIGAYIAGVPNGSAITVRHLAAMRSGLAEYTETEGFIASASADPGRQLPPRQLLDWAFAEPMEFAPGTRWAYSNTNYILLGLLVEKVSGLSLPRYLTEHVFGPLNLAHTSLPTDTRFPEPHARGYTEPGDDGGPPVDATDWSASLTGAAGAIVSTLDDMRTWVPALATGALLGPELQRQRLRNASGADLPAGVSYGIGVLDAAGWIGHNGSVPGFQTVAIYLPARETSLVVMLNTDIDLPDGRLPSSVVAEAITAVLTPEHVYRV